MENSAIQKQIINNNEISIRAVRVTEASLKQSPNTRSDLTQIDKTETQKDSLRKTRFEKLLALGTNPNNDPILKDAAFFLVKEEGYTDQYTIRRTDDGYELSIYANLYDKAKNRKDFLYTFDKTGHFKNATVLYPESFKFPEWAVHSEIVDDMLSLLGAHNVVKW